MMSAEVRFLLNDTEVATSCPRGMLVLDYLRNVERKIGTKEGCKEGDCGACVVLVGVLEGDGVRYRPVTSCLLPLGEMEGKHLVTVEGLNLDELSPVQRAIVEEGGTQCGFCTPGIVVSLNALLMDERKQTDLEGVKYALSGHLCRCTGYRSLKNCADHFTRDLGDVLELPDRIEALVAAHVLPPYFADIPARLQGLHQTADSAQNEVAEGHPEAEFRIAGGTDLYVQVGEQIPDATVDILNLYPEMRGIREEDGDFRIGALTTFEEFGEDPAMRRVMPELPHFMWLMASWQVRNRATLAGNIINASPIGDMTALLLALDCTLVFRGSGSERVVPMVEFYLGYKQMDKREDEILTQVIFPVPRPGTGINFEKVSKRTCLDIASVNSAIRMRVEDGIIREAAYTLGGVAPIPLFARDTSAFLLGRPLNMETAWEAIEISQKEIAPIDDVRGSAAYKAMLARQLLIAHFTKLYPDVMKVRDYYEAY